MGFAHNSPHIQDLLCRVFVFLFSYFPPLFSKGGRLCFPLFALIAHEPDKPPCLFLPERKLGIASCAFDLKLLFHVRVPHYSYLIVITYMDYLYIVPPLGENKTESLYRRETSLVYGHHTPGSSRVYQRREQGVPQL